MEAPIRFQVRYRGFKPSVIRLTKCRDGLFRFFEEGTGFFALIKDESKAGAIAQAQSYFADRGWSIRKEKA